MRTRFVFPAALLGLFLGCSGSPGTKKTAEPAERNLTIFATTELRGQVEPCGCTTNPLGDLARTAEMIDQVRASKRPVLVVDGGSLLYTEVPVPAHLRAQEQLKADLLREAFDQTLKVAAVGLGPNDFGFGPSGIKLPRQAANVPGDSGVPIAAPKVVELEGVRVGLFGVVAPELLAGHGIEAGDPVAAAREALASLQKQSPQIVVGLAYMDRKQAADLARAVPGIDFLVVGDADADPANLTETAQRIDDTYLIRPIDRGQVVSRIDITLRKGDGPLADAGGEARANALLPSLEAQRQELAADLDKWRADTSADPAFLATKEKQLAGIDEDIKKLREQPLQPPESGSWFVLAQVPISKGMACDQEIQNAKIAFDKAAGEANLAAAKASPKPGPPAPPEGVAGYVGAEECSYCHDEATEFWQTTRHFQAWETLETAGKQFNYECIGCHVTGWDRPGGATLAVNEHLRDVQCETCHGAGSLHIAADGADSPRTVVREPPVALCVGCHSKEHSDTFDFAAYLRDVTGPGHGAAFREQLGDGPTGRELRAAGLAKAGSSIGAGCRK
ncbi:multiheme c-type cytochrome [Haliangium ochraceum]|uniref:Cytochrome c-552/4 domain-containing protein n=1 Tax=Haliangium ochraceum (strain DSM 14365 / JCM 11303 / SMP-2) TaxID=502025 RepID=D0LKH0_HALO1|nr:multiheme c-type cytochrome [Haliangium ochraceum]ACY15018.1 conserved hypothetical protein [Haliangium ochraceum DSM 14365]